MLFVLFCNLIARSVDSDNENDDVIEAFLGKDIKIFLAAYSHIHLAENNSSEKGDFIGISKYYSSEKFKYNDRTRFNRDDEKYTFTIGDSKVCVKDKKKLVKCEDDQNAASFSMKRANHGYMIKYGSLCITKNDFFAIKMLPCTSGDDQVFDFKNIVDVNKCEELLNKKKEDSDARKKRGSDDELSKMDDAKIIGDDKPVGVQSLSQNIQTDNKIMQNGGLSNQLNAPQDTGIQKNTVKSLNNDEVCELNKLAVGRPSKILDRSGVFPIYTQPNYIYNSSSQLNNPPEQRTLNDPIHNCDNKSFITRPIKDLSDFHINRADPHASLTPSAGERDENEKYKDLPIEYRTPYGFLPFYKAAPQVPQFSNNL